MRILFVNPYYKPYLGGIERIIERLSRELLLYPEVEAIAVLTTRVYHPEERIWDHLPSHEVIDGVQVYRCNFQPARIPRLFNVDAVAGYVSQEVPDVLRRFRPSIIHFTNVYWWPANLQTYLCSLGTPHVTMTAYHPVMKARRTRPYAWVNRWLAQRMDAMHVFSAMEQQQIQQAFQAPPDRTVIIQPGVEISPVHAKRTSTGTVTIIAVGRLQAGKGQLRLVSLIQRIIEERSAPPIRLWLVGADSGRGAAIADFIAQHALGDIVTLFGYCSDEQLDELYQQADIFALPTQYESFGLVYIEAMAHGLPVITYGVGPVPTILTQGALVVEPNDEEAFYTALKELITDSAKRLRLGEEGRELVENNYSWQISARRTLDLYRQLLH